MSGCLIHSHNQQDLLPIHIWISDGPGPGNIPVTRLLSVSWFSADSFTPKLCTEVAQRVVPGWGHHCPAHPLPSRGLKALLAGPTQP